MGSSALNRDRATFANNGAFCDHKPFEICLISKVQLAQSKLSQLNAELPNQETSVYYRSISRSGRCEDPLGDD